MPGIKSRLSACKPSTVHCSGHFKRYILTCVIKIYSGKERTYKLPKIENKFVLSILDTIYSRYLIPSLKLKSSLSSTKS